MIQMVTCKNGHRFDISLTAECPECAMKMDMRDNLDPVLREKTILELLGLPVGWLLGVRGFARGDSYQLYNGGNKIGNPHALKGINLRHESVCAKEHCSIFYDSEKMEFYVEPINGMTYLNDVPLTTGKKIFSGDVLRIGEASFVIIPLRDANFSWDNWPDEENRQKRLWGLPPVELDWDGIAVDYALATGPEEWTGVQAIKPEIP